MSLRQRISEDMKAAMRAKDSTRLESIRLLRAAIQRREVDDRTTLDDDGIVTVVQKQIKQGQDAIAQFTTGGRADLAEKERAQIAVYQTYMPQPLAAAEVEKLITEALAESGATAMKDMGKVMGLLKPRLQGRADMSAVSRQIKARLGA